MKIEPKLRNKVEIDLYQAYKNAVHTAILNTTKFAYPFKSCINCGHWIDSNTIGPNGTHMKTANDAKFPPETCGLYKQRPPAKVIVFACDSHIEKNDVPY